MVKYCNFLYSQLIDNIECENWPGVATVFSTWIFGEDQRVIGGLIDRRREETQLFLEEIKNTLGELVEMMKAVYDFEDS